MDLNLTKRADLILSPDMEKHIIPAYDRSWGPSYVPVHSRMFEKLASSIHVPDKIIQVIDGLRPRDDGRYIHINAVGADGAWGANKNGDAFPEWSLLHATPPPDALEFLKSRGLPIPDEYGYETFETYAYPFVLHDNKDPAKSIGEKVACAAYNSPMKRVELIIFIYKQKAPDIVRGIDNGDPIPWSMGCKVPWDICTMCQNVARNRNQYCDHLKTLMNVTLPDGRRVAALNWFPKFFDISYVITPAFPSAYMLKKVAFAEALTKTAAVASENRKIFFMQHDLDMQKIAAAQLSLKIADTAKTATIEKEVPSEPGQKNLGPEPINKSVWVIIRDLVQKDQGESQDLPDEMLEDMRDREGPEEALNTLTSTGILLRRPELETLLRNDSANLPESLDLRNPNRRLLMKLKDWIGRRSMFDPPFAGRVVKIMRIRGRVVPGPEKVGSEVYSAYLDLLDKVAVEDLISASNAPELLLVRDPSAVEQAFLGVKTASDNIRSVMPFLVGVRWCRR
jgi:hypothetical protein